MSLLLNEVRGGLDILQPHILRAGDVYQHAVSAIDGGLHQRTLNRHQGCGLSFALACCVANAHVSEACALHDAGDVSEVEVDEAGVLDKVGNAGDGLTQNVVRYLKRVCESYLLISRVFQAVVRDDKQRIDLAEQLLDTGVCLVHTALALELERRSDNADGKYTGLARDIRDNGSRTGAGAAAHTGGDEQHVRIFNGLCYVVLALLGGILADLRVGSCALTMGHLLAYLELLIRVGNGQRLLVRIDGNKLDTLCAGLYHSIYDVVAGTADTNYLNCNNIFRTRFGLEIHSSCLPVLFTSLSVKYI